MKKNKIGGGVEDEVDSIWSWVIKWAETIEVVVVTRIIGMLTEASNLEGLLTGTTNLEGMLKEETGLLGAS